MTESSESRDPLDAMGDEFLDRLRRGERPDPAAFAARDPGRVGEIRDFLSALLLVEGLKPQGDVTAVGLGGNLSGSEPDLERLGDFRILRKLGRGGMGIVYEAEQESLGRRVALKVLAPGMARASQQVRRFLRESRAAARLHHTNIVPVFGVGEHNGLYYYAMQFIPGLGLDKVLEEIRRLKGHAPPGAVDAVSATRPGACDDPAAPLSRSDAHGPPPESSPSTPASVASPSGPSTLAASSDSDARYAHAVARVGRQVADALEYAHRQGTLHRDVKPSNILLDLHGVAWVTDFGLAKAAEDEDLTRTGDLVGTIRYMAPERFRGVCDAGSDVYGLGLVLYELLALRAAFDDSGRERLLYHVTHGEPPRLGAINPAVPRDLETIVHKAIEKEAAQRYATAADLGADLRRFLEGRPIRARRVGSTERLTRWARRNPGSATLGTALAGMLALIVVVITVADLRLRRQHQETLFQLGRAERAEGNVEKELLDSYIAHARQPSEPVRRSPVRGPAGDRASRTPGPRGRLPPGTPQRGDRLPGAGRPPGRASVAGACRGRLSRGRFRPGLGSHGPRYSGGHGAHPRHAGGRRPAPPAGQWDPRRLRPIQPRRPSSRREARRARAGSPSGLGRRPSRQGAGRARGHVSGRPRFPSRRRHRRRRPARRLDRPVRPDQRDRAPPSPPGWDPQALRFDPPGRRIVVVGPESRAPVQVRLVSDGAIEASWELPEPGFSADWHPGGRWLAVGALDGRIHIFDAGEPGRAPRTFEGHDGQVVAVAFHPAGGLLASASWDGTLRLWDARTGRELVQAPFPDTRLIRFSRDGRLLGPGHDVDASWLWEVAAGGECRSLAGVKEWGAATWSVGFLGPEGVLVSAGRPGVRLELPDRDGSPAFLTMPGTSDVAIAPDGSSLISSGRAGVLRWPVRRPSPQEIRIGPPEPFRPLIGVPTGRIRLGRGGRMLAAVVDDERGIVRILDLEGNAPPVTLAGHPMVERLDLSPDGRWLATGTWKGTGVKVWDTRGGAPARDLPVNGSADVAFSPDGRRLVTASALDYTVWDAVTWAPLLRVPWSQSGGLPGMAAFSPDGRLLAVARTRSTVQLLDAETGEQQATLEAPEPRNVSRLGFSPDGRLLVATSNAPGSWSGTWMRSGAVSPRRASTGRRRPGPTRRLASGPVRWRWRSRPPPGWPTWIGSSRSRASGRWDEAAAAYGGAIAAGRPTSPPGPAAR